MSLPSPAGDQINSALPDKPFATIILDSGPLILNDPDISSLRAQSANLVVTPGVLNELKDSNTRSRVYNSLAPFLNVKSPKAESLAFVRSTARSTGDLKVLSSVDISILALAWELSQPQTPAAQLHVTSETSAAVQSCKNSASTANASSHQSTSPSVTGECPDVQEISTALEKSLTLSRTSRENLSLSYTSDHSVPVTCPSIPPSPKPKPLRSQTLQRNINSDDGWITPENLDNFLSSDKRKQGKQQQTSKSPVTVQSTQQTAVATLTYDFALQNVLLSLNLVLISSSLRRVRKIKHHVLRCHACFKQVLPEATDSLKFGLSPAQQFCPRCGQPTLTRVTCTVDQSGNRRIFLKKNMQWNNRGNRYSVPKPVPSSATGKPAAGYDKSKWGHNLILSADQKEYQRSLDKVAQYQKYSQSTTALSPEDFVSSGSIAPELPFDKLCAKSTGTNDFAINIPVVPRVGAGRNVNSKHRPRR